MPLTMRLVKPARLAVRVAAIAAASADALDINEDVALPDVDVGTPYSFSFQAEEGCVPTASPTHPGGFLRG